MSAPLPFDLPLDLNSSSLLNSSDLGNLLSTTTGDKERGSPIYPLDSMVNTPLPQWDLEPWVDERDGIPLWQHYLAEELTRTIEFDKLCATTSAVFLDKLRASVALGPAVAPDGPSLAGALVRMVTSWMYGGGDARNPSADLQLALTREIIRHVESYSGWGAQLVKAYAFKQCVDSGEETWNNAIHAYAGQPAPANSVDPMLQSLSLLAYLGRQLQVVVNFEEVLSAVLPSVFSPGSMHLLLGSVYTVMKHPEELGIDIKRGLMVTLVSIINWYTHPTQTPIDADHAAQAIGGLLEGYRKAKIWAQGNGL